jgi:diaminopimelate decarboxylase
MRLERDCASCRCGGNFARPAKASEVLVPSRPVCESGDFIARERSMAAAGPGELLAIMTAGAYGAVEAGTYNTRALVPEVLVRESEWALVRPRVSAEELIALDRLPPWL